MQMDNLLNSPQNVIHNIGNFQFILPKQYMIVSLVWTSSVAYSFPLKKIVQHTNISNSASDYVLIKSRATSISCHQRYKNFSLSTLSYYRNQSHATCSAIRLNSVVHVKTHYHLNNKIFQLLHLDKKNMSAISHFT